MGQGVLYSKTWELKKRRRSKVKAHLAYILHYITSHHKKMFRSSFISQHSMHEMNDTLFLQEASTSRPRSKSNNNELNTKFPSFSFGLGDCNCDYCGRVRVRERQGTEQHLNRTDKDEEKTNLALLSLDETRGNCFAIKMSCTYCLQLQYDGLGKDYSNYSYSCLT